MFDPTNLITWAAPGARNGAGTLLCICGKPGIEFYVDGVETIDGQRYGILRGACCDDHWKLYKKLRDHAASENHNVRIPQGRANDPVQIMGSVPGSQDSEPLFAGLL